MKIMMMYTLEIRFIYTTKRNNICDDNAQMHGMYKRVHVVRQLNCWKRPIHKPVWWGSHSLSHWCQLKSIGVSLQYQSVDGLNLEEVHWFLQAFLEWISYILISGRDLHLVNLHKIDLNKGWTVLLMHWNNYSKTRL